MSIFELLGKLSTLKRRGMLGQTRLEFCEPDTVAERTLNEWIQMLHRAPLHQHVLENFAKHPWRGCKLTNQTLALKSEIRQNFELLSEKASQVAQILSPLEAGNLIPKDTKQSDLPSLLVSLETSLAVPEVPMAWFTSPREIAFALLDRHRAHLQSVRLRERLQEYADDVATRFCDDIVSLADLGGRRWLDRLVSPLPNSTVDCCQALAGYATMLREFESILCTLEKNLVQLIDETKLPLKMEPPASSIGRLVSAARLMATESPFRISWFDPDQARAIVADAENAIATIERIATMQRSVGDRISPDSLLELSRDVEDPGELSGCWAFVTETVSESQIVDLDAFALYLTQEQDRLNRLDIDLKRLSSELGLNGYSDPTPDEALALIRSAPMLLLVGGYCGKWIDPLTRNHIKQRVEVVLLDLPRHSKYGENSNRGCHIGRSFLPLGHSLIMEWCFHHGGDG